MPDRITDPPPADVTNQLAVLSTALDQVLPPKQPGQNASAASGVAASGWPGVRSTPPSRTRRGRWSWPANPATPKTFTRRWPLRPESSSRLTVPLRPAGWSMSCSSACLRNCSTLIWASTCRSISPCSDTQSERSMAYHHEGCANSDVTCGLLVRIARQLGTLRPCRPSGGRPGCYRSLRTSRCAAAFRRSCCSPAATPPRP
jgi:hypothetical protein